MTGDVDITGILGLSDNVPDEVEVALDDIVTDNVGDTDTEVNDGVTETLGDIVDEELGCNVANVRDTVDAIDVGVGLIDILCDGVVDIVEDDIVVVWL